MLMVPEIRAFCMIEWNSQFTSLTLSNWVYFLRIFIQGILFEHLLS